MVETGTIPVLIMAGGEGSRLWPITDLYPKALVPVAGKPCVRWVIDELFDQGFRNITICINTGTESQFQYELRDTIVQFSALPKKASICDRILQNETALKQAAGFIVVYADDLTVTDYKALVNKLFKSNAVAILATTRNAQLEFGLIQATDDVLMRIIEKPSIQQITGHAIWSGRVAFALCVLTTLKSVGGDLAKDVFPELLKQGSKLLLQNSNTPWYDVGSIAHWRKVNEAYAKSTW